MICRPGTMSGNTSAVGVMMAPCRRCMTPYESKHASKRGENRPPRRALSTVKRSRPPKKGGQRLRCRQTDQRTQASHRGGYTGLALGCRRPLRGHPRPRRSQARLLEIGGGFPPAASDLGGCRLFGSTHRLVDPSDGISGVLDAGDRQACRRPERLCCLAAPLGGRAHLCLVVKVQTVVQRLRRDNQK